MKKKLVMISVTASLAVSVLAGCQTQNEPAAVPEATVTTETAAITEAAAVTEAAAGTIAAAETTEVLAAAGLTVIEDGEVPLYQKPSGSFVYTPQATGAKTHSSGNITLDVSNASQGYCMVKYSGSVNKIKVQISKGSVVYTYDLNARSSYETFPFSEGNGTYSVKVFENVSGTQYSQAFSQDVSVSLANQFTPFLYPNQYVNFNGGSAVVQLSNEVAAPAADQIGVVNAVYEYVVNNLTYDTAKANSVTSGYLPNVDQVLTVKTGICFDYAAVMAAMLRSQDIPTKLVVGYTGDVYHAWINVYIENQGWIDNYIYFDGQNWSLMDPTFASTGNQSESVKQYIGSGSNYQAKYSY